MEHPLKCPHCKEFRYIEYLGARFEDSEKKKGFGVNIPYFICKNCGLKESILPHESLMEFKR